MAWTQSGSVERFHLDIQPDEVTAPLAEIHLHLGQTSLAVHCFSVPRLMQGLADLGVP